MEDKNSHQLDQLMQTIPGGMAKLSFNDLITIVYATDNFYSLIQGISAKTGSHVQSLLKMIYSADVIYVTQQIASQKNRKDNCININFRTLKSDGSFRWIMVSGNKTEEVYETGTKTFPVYSCVAIDFTEHMTKYKLLEQSFVYHNTISKLSKELFFEYEIASDTLKFSELFHEVFGRDSTITGFHKKLEKTKLIHEEELPAVIKIYKSMMSGKKQVRFELRLITKDGTPLWYICYASMIFDDNKNPYKVVGKLVNTK